MVQIQGRSMKLGFLVQEFLDKLFANTRAMNVSK